MFMARSSICSITVARDVVKRAFSFEGHIEGHTVAIMTKTTPFVHSLDKNQSVPILPHIIYQTGGWSDSLLNVQSKTIPPSHIPGPIQVYLL